MDLSSGLLARAHGQDHRGSAGHRVAACIDAVAGGHGVFIHDQTALFVRLQTGRGGAQQRIRAGSQGHDDRIHLQRHLAAGDGDGTAAAGSVGLAQLHADTFHLFGAAGRIAENAHGIVQQDEFHAATRLERMMGVS